MSCLLFGSSNVYRNFARAVEAGRFSGRSLQLRQCTRKTSLDADLITLTEASLVITSVLENFVVDVCTGVEDDEIQHFAHQQITAHVEDLNNLITRLPSVHVLVVPPIYRSSPTWFGSYLPDMISFLTDEIGRIGSSRMSVCSPFIVTPSMLEGDGVHLTTSGGDRFMQHIDSALQILLADTTSGDANDEPGMESSGPGLPGDRLSQILDAVNRNSSQLESFGLIGDNVSQLTRHGSEFEAFVRRRFKNDDFIFARMKEESDADVNKAREDRVVISGLPPPATPSMTHAEKKKHYVETVTRLVALACAATDPLPKVLDVYINLRKDRGLPLVEARLDTAAGSGLFRREGVKLAKAKHAEFSTLYFSNSVTQATRVRIDILKEIGKKLTTNHETAFVQGFISRPLLQYHVRAGERSFADGVGRGYTFVDAVARFGSCLSPRDLTTAYVRAGDTFRGALSQYFILLSDEVEARGQRNGANRVPLGRRAGPSGGPLRGLGHRQWPSLQTAAHTERGVKRTGEPSDCVPSKKKENVVEVEADEASAIIE
jgi:hypothetical protein